MRDFKDKQLGDRLQNAAQAKQAMLRKLQSMPGADDPAVIARRAEQQAIAAAREARIAERAAAKVKAEAERAEREALEQTERAALELREAQSKAEHEAALAVEQKAARDARYAARKKRKG